VSLLFLFVQFEFTHAIGPHAARYVVEPGVLAAAASESSPIDGAEPSGHSSSPDPDLDARNRQLAGVSRGVGGSDVLVVGVVSAPASRPRLLRRARPIEGQPPPAEVPLSLVTFVKGTEPLGDQREAAKRLDAIRASESEQQRWVREGLRALNLAIRAHRAGAPDPYAVEVTQRDPRRTRIGYGSTEEVQDGLWQEALELPPPLQSRAKRIERLRPSEAVATVLSGQSDLLEAEDLLLRALIDLDQGRTRAAAYQAASAMRLLPRELESRPGADGVDLELLADRAARTEELESAAGAAQLEAADVRELDSIIEAVARLLEARRNRRHE
jgi:hypothetical protein